MVTSSTGSAAVIDEWSDSSPSGEPFDRFVNGRDGAYRLVLKEPSVVAQDFANSNLNRSAVLLERPWRRVISMCGAHLGERTGAGQ
jgi:hypothetical protein